MKKYDASIIGIMESNNKSFTQLERTIADFFINNDKMMDFSAKKISERLYVSKAALSRFSKKCGYSGYREFIYVYKNQLENNTPIVEKKTKMVMDVYMELIHRVDSLVDEHQIKRIAEYLNSYECVLVCGIGNSGLAAQEMENRFMRVGVKIHSITSEDTMRMKTVFLDEKCLVIGMSLSGKTESVLYMLGKAHERNAKTVFLTVNVKEKLKKICDEIVIVPSLSQLERGNQISPQFPLLIMEDVIFARYLSINKYQKERYHEDTVRALNKEQINEHV